MKRISRFEGSVVGMDQLPSESTSMVRTVLGISLTIVWIERTTSSPGLNPLKEKSRSATPLAGVGGEMR